MKTFAGLTKAQNEVFAQICLGNDSGHNSKVVKALLNKGMVAEHEQTLTGFPPVVVKRYSFAVGWHIKWCQWCSEQEYGK